MNEPPTWEIAPTDGNANGDRWHVRRVDRTCPWFTKKQARAMCDALNRVERCRCTSWDALECAQDSDPSVEVEVLDPCSCRCHPR